MQIGPLLILEYSLQQKPADNLKLFPPCAFQEVVLK